MSETTSRRDVILAGMLCVVFACAPPVGPKLADNDLVIVDLDAGEPLADGERAGRIFLARAADAYARPVALTHDETWPEPVDVIVLPDRSLLVLDSRAENEAKNSRGAIFHLSAPEWAPVRWWTDGRARQPVSMVRGEDGTIYVADREADPLGLVEAAAAATGAAPDGEALQTGCVFAIRVEPAEDGTGPGAIRSVEVLAAGPELVTPAALLLRSDGLLLLMDADANPHGVARPDGLAGSPGVLFELRPAADGGRAMLVTLVVPTETVSPVALIERRPGEVYLVDANGNLQQDTLGDGVIWRVEAQRLQRVVDTAWLGAPHTMVDPVHGDVLSDGRLVIADANVDPLSLGPDGTGKGVYGTGRGALLVIDPDLPSLTTLIADERFVSPIAVRRVRP